MEQAMAADGGCIDIAISDLTFEVGMWGCCSDLHTISHHCQNPHPSVDFRLSKIFSLNSVKKREEKKTMEKKKAGVCSSVIDFSIRKGGSC